MGISGYGAALLLEAFETYEIFRVKPHFRQFDHSQK